LAPNKNPEQVARDKIDASLQEAGWILQDKKALNLGAGLGVAVREYQTDTGPADYILFVERIPVGVIEAKRPEEAQNLTRVEEQSEEYAVAKLKYLNNEKLSFAYESTGEITRFTDYRDPKPRSREVFTFHKPETIQAWMAAGKSLRRRLQALPVLPTDGLRECQVNAITNLEKSFKDARPKALIQMATGSGKTYTAITFIYRLLKYCNAGRILFLVDTKNLGEQAEQEFQAFLPNDDNRKFTELYNVTRLRSGFIPPDNHVYISTIQRMYSILKGEELDESAEENNPNELASLVKTPMPVVYNPRVPAEFFDFIVIDECHRSIYNLWKQVLDYFDAFQVGLTATPDNRTFGYFRQNIVSDYGYEKAVIDGVLVPYNVFTIQTKITKDGSRIALGEHVDKRERLTRKRFWEAVDEDIEYSGRQLDKDIVNPSTIRTIVQAMRDSLPAMFPDRITIDADGTEAFEVPKTLIFAKTDSHAEDIIDIVREEFAEENRFCRKITYRSDDDPKTILSQFRNDYYPRIAVTVDMIATGTDIRPLEVLVFMRDVKSRSYYEQMKGRGTRTCSLEELRLKGTPSAKMSKDHFVIIDAIGVEASQKTDSRPLEKQPGVSLKALLENVAMGNTGEEILSSLANRLIRLDRQINEKERMGFAEKSGGFMINHVVKNMLHAYDPDTLEEIRQRLTTSMPGKSITEIETAIKQEHQKLIKDAVRIFDKPEVRDYILDVRRKYDQIIDTLNPDSIVDIGWVKDQQAQSQQTIADFKSWIENHKDEITALQIFYDQPYRRRELTYAMIRELYDKIKMEAPQLSPLSVWRAYEQIGEANGSTKNELIALVSLIRRVAGIDTSLVSYEKTVDKNFQDWVFRKQAGPVKFTAEQMEWLRMIKDCIASSFHLDKDDFELDPFNKVGGLGKMWQLFGEETDGIIGELNEVLAA
jgi:type I restriction enzyme R subunit